ncbi:MAG: chloride channel protein [Gemmatimonadales bacterium]
MRPAISKIRLPRYLPLPSRIVAIIEDLRRQETHLALVLSLLIGALVGLVVVAFILLTGRLAAHMYPPGSAGWRRILVPTLGAVVTGWLLYRYFPLARGSGIPQTRAAVFIYDGRISLKSVVGKFVCCSTSLASGIALGREGPSVYIGSGLASVVARRLRLSKEQVKWIVPVGGAAALSAAFNTPIAAVLFTLEEIMGDLHAPVLGSVVLAAATSWMVLHLVLGDNPLFHVGAYNLVSPGELGVYAVLGVVGGLASVGFVRLLLWLRLWFARLPASSRWIQPVAGGLTVGLFGLFVPQVLGVGYDQVERVLNGDVLLKAVALLAVLKIIATAVAYASGNAGGIFGPSLFIGAMVGAAVGSVAHMIFPASTAGPGAYALVGMGVAFAGIVRTPLTSVIMIFELTRDYTIIVPLMISNLIAFFISQKLQHEPIYEALARQDGLHLPTRALQSPSGMWVTTAMRRAPIAFTPETKVSEALILIDGSDLESWPVADAEGLIGMVRLSEIIGAATASNQSETIATVMERAGESGGIKAVEFPHVHSDQPLGVALARMGPSGHSVLPVVSRANARLLVGVLTLADVLRAYGVDAAGKTPPAGIRPSMTDPTAEPASPPPAATASEFITTFATVIAAIGVLLVFDTVIAKVDRNATESRATSEFQAGERLSAIGSFREAADHLDVAVSLDRENPSYRVALAEATLGRGRPEAAEQRLIPVLQHTPTDGAANLAMARVKAKQGRTEDAKSYYHRAAIYGLWPADTENNRRIARFELIDLLARTGAKQELLGELLAIQDKPTNDPALLKRMAHLFAIAGSPARATTIYRDVLRHNSRDVEAYLGLADAAIQLGNYPTARADLLTAKRLSPGDTSIRARMELADSVIALDPTQRGLGLDEQYRRSRNLVQLTVASVEKCLGPEASQSALLRDSGSREPAAASRTISRSQAVDENLSLAAALWQMRRERCPADVPKESAPLSLVQDRIAQ